MERIIIAGGRDFNDYSVMREACDAITTDIDSIHIVSGTARGADQLGERYAKEKGYGISRYPADWSQHGKSAGYIRNKLMAVNADRLIAFWNRKSKGTGHMIDLAMKQGLSVHIIEY